MLKKMLHRVFVIWCLYGLVKLCIFVNPWLFRLAKVIKPVYEDNSEWEFIEDVPWNSSSPEQIITLWLFVFVCLFALFLASAILHGFSRWFFNENKDQKT